MSLGEAAWSDFPGVVEVSMSSAAEASSAAVFGGGKIQQQGQVLIDRGMIIA